MSAPCLLCAQVLLLSTASVDEATALTTMGAMNGAHAHQTTEESAPPPPAPTVLVAPSTMNDLPDDLLAHVLLCVEWKQGLRASRLVSRRWRGRLTRDWFLRWRANRKRFPESTQRELLRQVAQLDPLADGDLRGATALLASADLSVLVKSASYVSKARPRFELPSWGELDVQRHATGWELGQDAQVIVSWNSSLYPMGDDGNDDGMSYTKLFRPCVFLIYREEGARGFVWEFCQVDQYFDGEWGDFIQSECLTSKAGAREFKDLVAAYLPEVAEMSPSVLLALTICSSRTKLCNLLDRDTAVDCMIQENDACTVSYLSNLIGNAMAHPSGQDQAHPSGSGSSYRAWPYVSSSMYDAKAHPLETLSLWFAPFRVTAPFGADIANERLSLAKWVRSTQNKGVFNSLPPETRRLLILKEEKEQIPRPWLE